MKYLKFYLAIGGVVLTCLSSSAMAKGGSQQIRIIGGEESKVDAWPWMTAMVSRGRDAYNGQGCGASFVGKRYVLTASHCVEGATAEQLDVVVGIHDLKKEDSQGQRIAVRNIYMHESYSTPVELNNDIAILELEKEVPGVTPIKTMTPEIYAQIQAGTPLTVMGWGNRSTTGSDYPNLLHQVNVPLYDRASCKTAYPDLTEQMICAGESQGGKDSCQGDSGGPLVVKHLEEWYQIGVVSYGDGCGVAGKPGVYANVATFDGWIKQKMAGVSLRTGYDLGYVEEAFKSEHEFTLTNFTEAPLNIGNAIIENPQNLNNPSVVEDTCTGQSVAIDASCKVKIAIESTQPGESSFGLKIETSNNLVGEVKSKLAFAALPKATVDINEALDTNGIRWFTQAGNGWEIQSSQVAQGTTALQSGAIGDRESSVLLAVIENSEKMSIDFKTSTETDYDFFDIYVDGERVFSKSGAMTGFESTELPLTGNKQRVLFAYAKDAEVSENDDKVYIDKLVLSGGNQAPQIVLEKTTISVNEGESVELNATGTTDAEGDSLNYTWSQTTGVSVSLNDSNSAKATFTAPEVTANQDLIFKVVVTDSKGASAEKSVVVKVLDKVTEPPTETPSSSGGSGSFGPLLLILIFMLRRKITDK